MKKPRSIFAVVIFVFLAWLAVSTSCYADAYIEVNPLQHDFGDVQVGSNSTAIFTITNTNGHNLLIYSTEITDSGDFYISMCPEPNTIVESGSYTSVEVTFAPSATGYVTALLVIASNDVESPFVTVDLAGTGVGQETPPVSVADILAFFDASVADGTLYGYGPGRSEEGRRNALRNMIDAAGDLIDDGYTEQACQQLLDAYGRCDGLPRPPEFVAGTAAANLAQMILDLIAQLGCTI